MKMLYIFHNKDGYNQDSSAPIRGRRGVRFDRFDENSRTSAWPVRSSDDNQDAKIEDQHEASLSLPRSYEETCPHLVDSVAIIKDQRDGGGC